MFTREKIKRALLITLAIVITFSVGADYTDEPAEEDLTQTEGVETP